MSAQGEAPGLRPAAALPSNAVPGVPARSRSNSGSNQQLPLDCRSGTKPGESVKLGDYFGSKPVVLAFVYYECPMLCTQVLNGLVSALRVLDQTVGKEFDVVAISFDPRETPVMAAAKKAVYLDPYKRPSAEQGWHFLTGDEAAIRRADQGRRVQYVWDEATQQFAHASGIIVATPDGRLSRYFFGIEYPPRDLKFALMESSAGKIGSVVDQVLLYCYHYDPATGNYSFVAMNAVRLGGAVTRGALRIHVRGDSSRGATDRAADRAQ